MSITVRLSEEDLEEEYMKAVDNLTINEENRLKRKVEKLEVEASHTPEAAGSSSKTRSQDQTLESLAI